MPFNRVNNVKATSFWLAFLQMQAKKEADRQSSIALEGNMHAEPEPEQKMNRYIKALIDPQLPYCWVPGLLVVPIPEAGFFLGYIDVAFWATFLYVIGSVIYVVDSFYLWIRVDPDYSDDANNPAIYLNTLAATMFVFNALVCFLDWHLQVQQLSAMNMFIDEALTGGLHVSDIPMNITWYYFFNNLFFLGAAVVFMIQSIWMEDLNTDLEGCEGKFCNDFWMNFWGNFLYLLSSLFSCAESFEDRALRKRDGLPMVYLFTTNIYQFDWFGWGDVIYVFVSISALAQTFFMFNDNITDDDSSVYYVYVNLFFLVDSIVYFIGYMLFIYELKRGITTGKIPVSQTAAISNLIGENFESNDDEDQDHQHLKSFIVPANHDGFVDVKVIQESLRNARAIRLRRTAAQFRVSDVSASSVSEREKEKDVVNPMRNTIATSVDISSKEKNTIKATFSIARSSKDYM